MVWPVIKQLDHFKTVQVCNWSVAYICVCVCIYIYIYIYVRVCLLFYLHRRTWTLYVTTGVCVPFSTNVPACVLKTHGNISYIILLWGIC